MGSYTVIVFILRQNTMDTPDTSAGKLNVNRYATKKTLAQGMLDIALLTANASQLKYILQVGSEHEFYTAMLVLVITSLVLQVIVGALFLILGGIDINDQERHKTADILNNSTTVLVFIITFVNVIISGFGFQHTNTMAFD